MNSEAGLLQIVQSLSDSMQDLLRLSALWCEQTRGDDGLGRQADVVRQASIDLAMSVAVELGAIDLSESADAAECELEIAALSERLIHGFMRRLHESGVELETLQRATVSARDLSRCLLDRVSSRPMPRHAAML